MTTGQPEVRRGTNLDRDGMSKETRDVYLEGATRGKQAEKESEAERWEVT